MNALNDVSADCQMAIEPSWQIESELPDNHTILVLNCSGEKELSLPSSCSDLSRIGHRLSGFYPVKTGNEAIGIVFCNFTQKIQQQGRLFTTLIERFDRGL